MHMISYWRFIVSMALSCIFSEIKLLVENRDFSFSFYANKHLEKTVPNIFALFYRTEPDPWSVRWCKLSLQKVLCLHTQLKRVTD